MVAHASLVASPPGQRPGERRQTRVRPLRDGEGAGPGGEGPSTPPLAPFCHRQARSPAGSQQPAASGRRSPRVAAPALRALRCSGRTAWPRPRAPPRRTLLPPATLPAATGWPAARGAPVRGRAVRGRPPGLRLALLADPRGAAPGPPRGHAPLLGGQILASWLPPTFFPLSALAPPDGAVRVRQRRRPPLPHCAPPSPPTSLLSLPFNCRKENHPPWRRVLTRRHLLHPHGPLPPAPGHRPGAQRAIFWRGDGERSPQVRRGLPPAGVVDFAALSLAGWATMMRRPPVSARVRRRSAYEGVWLADEADPNHRPGGDGQSVLEARPTERSTRHAVIAARIPPFRPLIRSPPTLPHNRWLRSTAPSCGASRRSTAAGSSSSPCAPLLPRYSSPPALRPAWRGCQLPAHNAPAASVTPFLHPSRPRRRAPQSHGDTLQIIQANLAASGPGDLATLSHHRRACARALRQRGPGRASLSPPRAAAALQMI